MTISPIEERYGRREIKAIFEEQNRLNMMVKVESAIMKAQMRLSLIPDVNFEPIDAISKTNVNLKRMKEIEVETQHDLMAFIRTVDEQTNGKYIYLHYGVTSNDIIDTATALQLKSFSTYLDQDLKNLCETIIKLIKKYDNTPMLGRTHGQHASPITFGLKLSTYLMEFTRHFERFQEAKKRFLVGKALGPVGTGASMGTKGLELSREAMSILGLTSETATNQLVSRDRYVELLSVLSMMAVTVDKIGTEIRNLQRPEIGEVMEFFDRSKQVGSSSMPSKRNPIKSENVCSISRIIRSMVTPEMEAAITWHERDLTNSALERFTIPYSCILTDYILFQLNRILDNLWVDEKRMLENLNNSPLCISEALTTALTRKNVGRQEAHEIIRNISMDFYEKKVPLITILKNSPMGTFYSEKEIENMVVPENFLGSSLTICQAAIREYEDVLRRWM